MEAEQVTQTDPCHCHVAKRLRNLKNGPIKPYGSVMQIQHSLWRWVATASLSSTLTADVYGLKTLGTITGVSFLFHQVGGLAGVLIGGFLYDLTSSYTLPFAIVGATLFPAGLSAFSIKERTYSSRYQTAAVPATTLGM